MKEWREKARQEERPREQTGDKMKKKREEIMIFSWKNVQEPQISQLMFRKKTLLDEFFLHFSKVKNLTVFSIIYMIRIRFFRAGWINSVWVSGRTVHVLVLAQTLKQNFGYASYTDIGPVLDVKFICHHNVDRIEIQISSTSGDKIKVWVVISRSSNRYVDEWRHRESKDPPE